MTIFSEMLTRRLNWWSMATMNVLICGCAYPIVKDIQQQLGSDLKLVFRNFPLSKIHPLAFSAAVATEAAGLQDKFWEMHDIIFENQKVLNTENLFHFVVTIGLDL